MHVNLLQQFWMRLHTNNQRVVKPASKASAVPQDYAIGIDQRKAPGCLLPVYLLVL
jgi:hypothetical protein